MFTSCRILFVAAEIATPSLRQRYVNGPAPEGCAVHRTESPAQCTSFEKPETVTGALIDNVAEFVAVLHKPDTSTLYTPAWLFEESVKESVLLVSPESNTPPLRHTKENGPAPEGVV